MSLLPRLLLARHLSRGALQAQLQACIAAEASPLSESMRNGPAWMCGASLKVCKT